MSDFASRARDCRKNKGFTQKQIAAKFGISERTWQDYERGIRTPTFEGLLNFADFFGVSIDYLVGRSDNPENVTGEKEKLMEFQKPAEKDAVSPSESEQIVIKFKTRTMETELKFPRDISKEKIEDALEAVSAVFNEKIASPKPRLLLPPAVGGDIPHSEITEHTV
jgi:transcriptional regulator with XRE-family HTH domain